jgi:hypothetical protein
MEQNYVYLMHYALEWWGDEYNCWCEFDGDTSVISVHKTLTGMMATAEALFKEQDLEWGESDKSLEESSQDFLEHGFRNALQLRKEWLEKLESVRINRDEVKIPATTDPIHRELYEMWGKHGTYCYTRTYWTYRRRYRFNFSKFDFIDLDKTDRTPPDPGYIKQHQQAIEEEIAQKREIPF